ncbi:hypothetical protein ACHAPU_011333, partial [Fusarium lateritium]
PYPSASGSSHETAQESMGSFAIRFASVLQIPLPSFTHPPGVGHRPGIQDYSSVAAIALSSFLAAYRTGPNLTTSTATLFGEPILFDTQRSVRDLAIGSVARALVVMLEGLDLEAISLSY